jgi:hypothetical protein
MNATIRQPSCEADSRDFNMIWFAEECLNNGVRLERHLHAAERAGDRQLADFFRRALAEARHVQDGDPRLRRLRHAAKVAEFGSA